MIKTTLGIICMSLSIFLITGCQKNPEEEIRGFEKWELNDGEYMELAEGITVQEWVNESSTERRYQFEDGTELLHVSVTKMLVSDAGKKGLVGLPDMSEEAQRIVEDYYSEQREMFDTKEELQVAYQDFCEYTENGEKFNPNVISQEITPTAESKRYVAFLTAVVRQKTEHLNGATMTEYANVLFDRETGDIIDMKDLFKVPMDDVQKQLAALCGTEDTTVSDFDVYDVMDQADILFFQDYLEVWIPCGTWERQEFDKGFGLKYDKLSDLLNDWAIPIGSE